MEAFTQYYQVRSLIALCCLSTLANTISFFSTSFTSPMPVDMVVRTTSCFLVIIFVRYRFFNVSSLLTFLFVFGSAVLFYVAYTNENNTMPPVLTHLSEFAVTPLLGCYMIRGRGGLVVTAMTIGLYFMNFYNSLGVPFLITKEEETSLLFHGVMIQLFPLWILFSYEGEMKTYQTLLEKFLETSEEHGKEKTTFISRMSHELRTPLHGLLASANLLRHTPISMEQTTFLTTIDSCGQMILGVVTKILDITKIESGDFEKSMSQLSLFELAKSVSESLASQAEEKGIEFVVDFKLDVQGFDVNGDKGHIREILMNVSF